MRPPWRSNLFALAALENAPEDPIGRQRRIVKANAYGIRQRIGQRRCDWIDRRLAHRFRTERSECIVGLGEIDFGTWWDIRKSRDAVVAEGRIDHAPSVIENHLFEQRPAEPLRDRPFDLRSALHRIDDHAAVGAMNAL